MNETNTRNKSDTKTDNFKFFVTNFEPYNVYKTISKYQTIKRYHKLFKMRNMGLDGDQVV